MAAPTKSTSAGNELAFLSFFDENSNFLIGGTRTAPIAGDQDGSPAVRVLGIKSASPVVGEPDNEPVTGDNGLLSEFPFSNIDPRGFVVQVAVRDLDLAASMNNVKVFSAAGAKFMPLDTEDVDDRDACLILQADAKDAESGASKWSGVFALKGTTKYLGRETFEERAAGAYRFKFTPQLTLHLPWGVTMTNSTQGTTSSRYQDFSSDHAMHLQSFTGDGTETEFNLKHDPISLSKIEAWEDRVNLSISSLSGNTITFASAPTNNRPVIVLYQFDRYNS